MSLDRQKRLEELLPALQRLDTKLEQAASQAENRYGVEAVRDPYRGLYINPDEFKRHLASPPGTPTFSIVIEGEFPAVASGFGCLQQSFSLASFDLDIVLIALAPEFDLRYERLYAYLQDDVTRKRPSVDLALNLLCASAVEKLERRSHFAPNAPLIRHGLLHLEDPPQQAQAPLLAKTLRLDDAIARFLLAQACLSEKLAHHCELLLTPNPTPESWQLDTAIAQALQHLSQQQPKLAIYLHGPQATQRLAAEVWAAQLNQGLLIVNLERLLVPEVDFLATLKAIFREAQLLSAIAFFTGIETLDPLKHEQLFSQLQEQPWGLIFGGTQSLLHSPYTAAIVTIDLPGPDYQQRRQAWQANLNSNIPELSDWQVTALADRFRLQADQIAAATQCAFAKARWRAASTGTSLTPTADELFAAAREQSGQALGAIALKVEPKYDWDALILPLQQQEQLQEICQQVQFRSVVFTDWGFDRCLSLGKGLNVLFYGPPGTGKTMAAEAIARALQLDLYKIDLSQVVSKYIGETEKNLDRIFSAAETANAILFFDEADALFGKRSEVKDARDRYANLEVSYLLQKMEAYAGVVILATNLRQNLDDAFIRRLQAIVEFPFPDATARQQIWERVFPPPVPLDKDIDFALLGQHIKLAGANLRNIALLAAFLAAADGGVVCLRHVVKAAEREYQKIGQTWSARTELGRAIASSNSSESN